jgi:hypothetical protein
MRRLALRLLEKLLDHLARSARDRRLGVELRAHGRRAAPPFTGPGPRGMQ